MQEKIKAILSSITYWCPHVSDLRAQGPLDIATGHRVRVFVCVCARVVSLGLTIMRFRSHGSFSFRSLPLSVTQET